MDNIQNEQIEALNAVIEYNKKLIPALNEVMIELNGELKEDTFSYLDYILKGVNWVIQVMNGTRSLFEEKGFVIDKGEINEIINSLNKAVKEKDSVTIAQCLREGVLPFCEQISIEAVKIV